MSCIKCEGELKTSKSASGATIDYCRSCKGILINRESLEMVYKSNPKLKVMLNQGLEESKSASLDCPSCEKDLTTGKLAGSDITVEYCKPCDHYYFDDKEMKQVFDLLNDNTPVGNEIDLSNEELVESDTNCCICDDVKLVGVKGKLDHFTFCPKCEGVASNVAYLQRLAGKSLFGPTMFEFRSDANLISHCRYCQHVQSADNKDCESCGKEIVRLNCHSCNSRFAEYRLNEMVIDRCQMCNSVWLDHGEFDQLLTIMPDVRRHIERNYVDGKIRSVRSESMANLMSHSIEQTRREMIDRFWGPIGASIFY